MLDKCIKKGGQDSVLLHAQQIFDENPTEQTYKEACNLFQHFLDIGLCKAGTFVGVITLTAISNSLFSVEESTLQRVVDALRISAGSQDPGGQFILGMATLQGIEQGNFDEALHLLTNAAQQGNSMAVSELGRMYLNGKFVTPDESFGIKLLQLAAEHQNIDCHHLPCEVFGEGPAFWW